MTLSLNSRVCYENMPVLQACGSSRCTIFWDADGVLLIDLCLTKWQLWCSIMLTYFTNCLSEWKRIAKLSWPRYSFFCISVNLLTGHMPALLVIWIWSKCVIHHILLIWYQVITICLKIQRNTSMKGYFWLPMSSNSDQRGAERTVRTFLFTSIENSEIGVNCALRKAVILLILLSLSY